MEKKNDLTKTFMIGLSILFCFSTFSLIVSILMNPEKKLQVGDYFNIGIMAFCLIVLITLIIIRIIRRNKSKQSTD